MKAILSTCKIRGDIIETCTLTNIDEDVVAIISANKIFIADKKVASQFIISAYADDGSVGASLFVDELEDNR